MSSKRPALPNDQAGLMSAVNEFHWTTIKNVFRAATRIVLSREDIIPRTGCVSH